MFGFLLFLGIASAAISLIIQGLPHDVAPVATKPHPDQGNRVLIRNRQNECASK